MKRILPVLLFFLLVVPVLAYTVPDDTMVYVSEHGEKYHRENCSYISSSETKEMTIKVAEKMGYGACSRCDPDQKTGVYISDEKETGESKNKNSEERKPVISEDSSGSKGRFNLWDFVSDLMLWIVVFFCFIYFVYVFISIAKILLEDVIDSAKRKAKKK